MTTLKVRPLQLSDQADWKKLWQGYLDFYKQDLPDDVTETVWKRLMNPDHELRGFVALLEDEIVGFTHYFCHVSTWNVTSYCYLEDLYVDQNTRSQGVGRALIMTVKDTAQKEGATKLYWFTNKDNKTAQALYNKVADVAPFLRYDILL